MKPDAKNRNLLRMLPGVDRTFELVKADPFFENIPKTIIVNCIRTTIDELRKVILNTPSDIDADVLTEPLILQKVREQVIRETSPNLKPVVNATGVVVHTNLGRSLLPPEILENITSIAGRYSNLEFNLATGNRGSRYSAVEGLICEITGAESAMVVNNNAGAVLLCLETLARGREAVVSRGELVEIGGAFRIPDVMEKSGSILREVGTTNRTHLRDYENAITPDTALFLKVHTSNYCVVGFTASVPIRELAAMGHRCGIPVMDDLGSGIFMDLSSYGLDKEPTVQDSVRAGADVITFSGDKLLGGPQAGIIVGKIHLIDQIRKNPLARALRIDKMTLAALESLLRLYKDPQQAIRKIPTLRMLTCPIEEIEQRAVRCAEMLAEPGDDRLCIKLLDRFSKVGGGALPLQELPSKCLGITLKDMSVNALEKRLRTGSHPVVGRIEDGVLILDFRTVQEDELSIIRTAFRHILERDET